MKKFVLPLLFFIGVYATGCSHPMRVVNGNDYFAPPAPPKEKMITIGITSNNSGDAENSRYITSIVDGLQRTGSFNRIIYPYNQSMHKDQVDFVADISVNPRYEGEGMNFLVNWPGFLIFAPAIWGYGYRAQIETMVNITSVKDGSSQQMAIPTNYRFRQAEIDRTWTEIGWLEFGVIPLIGGIVFTQYDTDVTDEFITKVSPSYGSFVAKRIVDSI